MKTYKLEIKDKNKEIIFRSRIIKTPIRIKISEEDLDSLMDHLRASQIEDYLITEEIVMEEKDDKIDSIMGDEVHVVVIEELTERKPKDILKKLTKNGE
jgi:hypothetical protein